MAYKIERDKKKHFFVGIPLGFLLQVIAVYVFPNQELLAYSLSFLILVAICYGFELFSKVTGKGHADHLDAIAGILGGILGQLFYWIFSVWN
jgi:glycopeptide antibiotics resistance protein